MILHRMQHLITVMRNVAETKKPLMMDTWIDYTDRKGPSDPCGTACCVAGYCALDPTFQVEGLVMQWIGTNGTVTPIFTIKDFNTVVKPDDFACGRAEIIFDNGEDFTALQKCFGISSDAADYLFDPSSFPNPETVTPEEVIARAEEVIVLGGNCPAFEEEFSDT